MYFASVISAGYFVCYLPIRLVCSAGLHTDVLQRILEPGLDLKLLQPIFVVLARKQ